MRAFAALLVFLFHIGHGVVDIPLSGIGETGVAFFFVLSGFLLTWTYTGKIRIPKFYRRRFARIYPSHLAILLVALIVPVLAHPPTLTSLIASLTLTQAWVPLDPVTYGLNGVAWSLSCEIAFYIVFPLVVSALRRVSIRATWIVTLTALLMAGSVTIWVSLGATSPIVQAFGFANPLVRFPEFLLGMAIALAMQSGWRLNWRVATLITFGATTGLVLVPQRPADNFFMAPVYAMVIVAAAQAEMRGAGSFLRSRPLVYLGKISFAFYLVQGLTIDNLRPVTGSGVLSAGIMLAVSVAGACLMYEYIETPAQKLLSGRMSRRPEDGRRRRPQEHFA